MPSSSRRAHARGQFEHQTGVCRRAVHPLFLQILPRRGSHPGIIRLIRGEEPVRHPIVRQRNGRLRIGQHPLSSALTPPTRPTDRTALSTNHRPATTDRRPTLRSFVGRSVRRTYVPDATVPPPYVVRTTGTEPNRRYGTGTVPVPDRRPTDGTVPVRYRFGYGSVTVGPYGTVRVGRGKVRVNRFR